ncbi:MAG: carboxypeptidase regulatory-like domain-containing protein [Planctomycetia bacterium]|nr:carboxypeptidase regulatory-like domain-containing protein [Planctomycetia bacterium]
MSRRVIVLGVVGSAVALAAIAALGPRPRSGDARPGPARSPPVRVVETPPLPDDRVARALALAERATGLVIDLDGRPVAGARVVARLPDGTASATTSDAKGRFAVAVPGSESFTGVAVEATAADGRRGTRLGFLRGRAGDFPVVVGERRTLRVRVVDPRGTPVEGARVMAGMHGTGWGGDLAAAESARDGTATLDLLRVPSGTCVVGAEHADVGRGESQVPADAADGTDVEVRLDRPPVPSSPPRADVDVDIAGVVLEAGRPLAGATVSAAGPRPLPEVVTDAEGRFRFRGRGAPPNSILVRRAHGVTTWASLERGTRIDLEPLTELVGRVLDDDGAGVPGVTVTDMAQHTVTAADGGFRLWSSYADADLLFRATGFLGVNQGVGAREPVVTLQRGGAVAGYVLAEDGTGLDGVRWRVEGEPPDPKFVTRYGGSFRGPLSGGPWTLVFEADGYASVTVPGVEPDSVVPTFRMRRLPPR